MISDKELREQNPELYNVARIHGTEPAFTGKYFATKEDGMYHCAVCDQALFSSDKKYSSGSGWPSFTDPATDDVIEVKQDVSFGMIRMEVLCKNCGSHLGHVFPDGPKKDEGGVCDRYCVNSISLNLKKEHDN